MLVSDKIGKIRYTFVPSGTENDVHPPSDPPEITAFTQVSEDVVDKIIPNSPTKPYLLDPWPTFHVKECSNILRHQLQSWSTAHSWRGMALMVSKLL